MAIATFKTGIARKGYLVNEFEIKLSVNSIQKCSNLLLEK